MIKYYSINGELVLKEEATLGVGDLAIQRGYGLFDFFMVKKGQPLFLTDYLDRVELSARTLNLELPFSREELKRQVFQVIRANGLAEAGLKIVVTGGYASDGYSPSTPNVLILELPPLTYPTDRYEAGVKLMLFEYHRTFPTAKTINYIVGINLLPQMRAAGAEDVLFHSGGHIYETTRANFFIVAHDGAIVTAGDGILKGVTRKHTIKAARQHYKVEERPLAFDEVRTAKEAFITSSTKRVMPVVRLDGITIGDGKPGPVSRHLLQLLMEEEERYLTQTPVLTT